MAVVVVANVVIVNCARVKWTISFSALQRHVRRPSSHFWRGNKYILSGYQFKPHIYPCASLHKDLNTSFRIHDAPHAVFKSIINPLPYIYFQIATLILKSMVQQPYFHFTLHVYVVCVCATEAKPRQILAHIRRIYTYSLFYDLQTKSILTRHIIIVV